MDVGSRKISEIIAPDPNLSKRLLKTLITSPLLGRTEPVRKPEHDQQNENKLFVTREKSNRIQNACFSQRKADLSKAIRDKLVKIDLGLFPKNKELEQVENSDTRKIPRSDSHRNELLSSIDLQRKKKVEELYQKSSVPSGSKLSVGKAVSYDKLALCEDLKQDERSLKLITFQTWSKEYSMFGTKYISERSPSRLGNLTKDLHPDTKVKKGESPPSLSRAKSTFLQRVYSTLDLDRGFKTSASGTTISTQDTVDLTDVDDQLRCRFPGAEPGKHCHSVAATVLGKGKEEAVFSSDSSLGDVFESTRFSRDIIEERLCNNSAGDRKKRKQKKDEQPRERRKSKTSVRIKKSCRCAQRARHNKCLKKGRAIQDTPKSKMEGFKQPRSTDSENEPHHCDPQLLNTVKPASRQDILKSVGSQSASPFDKGHFIPERTCNKETCSAAKGATCWKTVGSNIKEGLKAQLDPKEDFKMEIRGQMKGSQISLASSAISLRTVDEPCSPKTCQFRQLKSDFKLTKLGPSSSGQRSKQIRREKQLCNIRCKIRTHKKREKQQKKTKTSHLSKKITSKVKRHRKKMICTCHELTLKYSSSESDNIWMGMDNMRQNRPSLMLDRNNKKKFARCSGLATKDAQCTCYMCAVKEKPWRRFMRKANLFVDIPYFITAEMLEARAKEIAKTKKVLKEKFNWSEEDVHNFGKTCKSPDSQKMAIPDNYGRKWCDSNKNVTSKAKDDNPQKNTPGRLGYYMELNDERLMFGEPHTSLQRRAERVAFCKWNADVAKMKMNHFINNRPFQQSCVENGRRERTRRQTCFNNKLIERLEGLVQFSTDSDRSIHEFSFPSKMIKYQEPQLVEDAGSKMPEMKPLYEKTKLPTIYRDLFKDLKHDQRKLMDAVLPPLQWTDNLGFWEMKVSLEPDEPETNRKLLELLDRNNLICHAINKTFCAGNYRLHFEVFAEVIRQEMLRYPERAILLSKIRDEYLLTMLLLDGGLEMTLASTTHVWREIEANVTGESQLLLELEQEVERIQSEIKVVTAAVYDLEKRSEELQTVDEYLHEDQGKLYKKTNIQMQAQIEAISAGYFYDLD